MAWQLLKPGTLRVKVIPNRHARVFHTDPSLHLRNPRDGPVRQGNEQRHRHKGGYGGHRRTIERVYDEADYVGSLVVAGASDRPTEYDGPKVEPPGWWEDFWHRFENNLQFSRWEALDVLRELGAVAFHWFQVLR